MFKIPQRLTILATMFIGAGLALAASAAHAAKPEAAVTPGVARVVDTARAGPVNGMQMNSDEFIWRLFTKFTAPTPGAQPPSVIFDTWASDADTFTATPAWPSPGTARKFQASALLRTKLHGGGPVDLPCIAPGNAAAGGFPVDGTPVPCIAEEVRRNRPQFDYIKKNGLHTRAGLAAAYQRALDVQMPTDAVSVKGDWVPVDTLLKWIPELRSPERIRSLYYTSVSEKVEYALVALHVSSRQNPNWVWGTFEHQKNPGRCDDLGCYDSFGAEQPVVAPNRRAINTQYGACDKSSMLQMLMTQAKLSPVWQNYCLKSTQVDYVTADGTPTALGNSVIERVVGNGTVTASSCIACHAYASYDATGATSLGAKAMLPFNPTGAPMPAVLKGSRKFDFMWGVLQAK
ncbi:hypothetical protein O0880_13790 [Janthinobacterium sp. SUN118]|uniref:hypothetical protein n=1 Tax=Janthinobacterium sp. SUN118 TaxID=3004100 RepID=UPI0025B12FC9|nr:hypothetical protein [Janthinobacterium sp. SUN118]MDN2710492.1 hypothetical protein [Janthinobacterium sp. SUN118]